MNSASLEAEVPEPIEVKAAGRDNPSMQQCHRDCRRRRRVTLFATGATVGVLSGGPLLHRGVRQLGIGAAAAVVTYGLGRLLNHRQLIRPSEDGPGVVILRGEVSAMGRVTGVP
jgi:hypothetical protein